MQVGCARRRANSESIGLRQIGARPLEGPAAVRPGGTLGRVDDGCLQTRRGERERDIGVTAEVSGHPAVDPSIQRPVCWETGHRIRGGRQRAGADQIAGAGRRADPEAVRIGALARRPLERMARINAGGALCRIDETRRVRDCRKGNLLVPPHAADSGSQPRVDGSAGGQLAGQVRRLVQLRRLEKVGRSLLRSEEELIGVGRDRGPLHGLRQIDVGLAVQRVQEGRRRRRARLERRSRGIPHTANPGPDRDVQHTRAGGQTADRI